MAGQIPADAQGNLVTGSIAEKTEQCCKNLKAILDEAGSEIGKIVRVGVSFFLFLPISLPMSSLFTFHTKGVLE